MLNALNAISVYGETYDVALNGIGQFIGILIEAVGSVGVGIILFSLILKLIVLPFDIYQRVAMRKQNIKMKENQARMEKLQKQYANNKELYNQKLMEMYKENGISMFSSCLPMILSMVIFFVAIDAFNVYAQYASVRSYNDMVEAYHGGIEAFCPVLDDEKITIEEANKIITIDEANKLITVKSNDKEVFYSLKTPEDYSKENYPETNEGARKLSAYINDTAIDQKTFEVNKDKEGYDAEKHTDAYYESLAKDAVVVAYNEKIEKETSFLWIENVWKTDASYVKPVWKDYQEFSMELQKATGCSCNKKGAIFDVKGKDVSYVNIKEYTSVYEVSTPRYGEDGTIIGYDGAYENITEKLTAQKNGANGYFILIALSIGTILLQQFVMQRSQKEQQKYSSVDGSAGSQQKMTMIIMTGMFAIFSFMYSSAFSIYMITSNVFSMLSTFIINLFVDRKAEKKEEAATMAKLSDSTNERIEKARAQGKQAAQEIKKKNK